MSESVYDKINLSTDLIEDDFDKKRLEESMSILDGIDGELDIIEGDLDDIKAKHYRDELTLAEVKDFLEDNLPAIIGQIKLMRERLY